MLTVCDIIKSIRENLSEDLLSSKWRRIVMQGDERHQPVAGHCAIATEAIYDILGGAMAGYTPYVCGYYRDEDGQKHFGKAPLGYEPMTHWWLRAPHKNERGGGAVVDVTVRQYKKPFPYQRGVPAGFMSPYPPSKRARLLIERVEKDIGKSNVDLFRKAQIKAFEDAGGSVKPSKTTLRRYQELKTAQRL